MSTRLAPRRFNQSPFAGIFFQNKCEWLILWHHALSKFLSNKRSRTSPGVRLCGSEKKAKSPPLFTFRCCFSEFSAGLPASNAIQEQCCYLAGNSNNQKWLLTVVVTALSLFFFSLSLFLSLFCPCLSPSLSVKMAFWAHNCGRMFGEPGAVNSSPDGFVTSE